MSALEVALTLEFLYPDVDQVQPPAAPPLNRLAPQAVTAHAISTLEALCDP
jgi:hypothetical protein